MQVQEERLVVPRHEGRTVWLGGVGVVYKVEGEETEGRLSIVEHPVRPGTLVPPHVHKHEDELSYVLDGELGARVGDQIVHATAGHYVFKPRGVPHTFWNRGPGECRFIELIYPAGFERYFEEMAALFPPDGGLPDFSEVAQLGARYGLTFFDDWVPELTERYGLTVLGL